MSIKDAFAPCWCWGFTGSCQPPKHVQDFRSRPRDRCLGSWRHLRCLAEGAPSPCSGIPPPPTFAQRQLASPPSLSPPLLSLVCPLCYSYSFCSPFSHHPSHLRCSPTPLVPFSPRFPPASFLPTALCLPPLLTPQFPPVPPTSQPLLAPVPTPASCTLLPMPLTSPHCPCPTPSPLSTNPKGTVAPFGAGGRVVVRVTSHPQHRSPPHPSAPRDEPRAWGAGSRPGASLTAPSPHLCSPTASLPSPPLLGGPCSSPFPRGPAARARPCPFSVSPPPRAPFPCPGPCSSAGAAR